MANEPATTAAVARIESLILAVRGQRVMLDSNLARVYGVTTSQLNQALKRNPGRFPQDFAFQLSRPEFATLISQSVISKTGRGGRQKAPWVFTEHGAIMLAGVLNSSVAVEASVRVVRAFVYLREQLTSNRELARKFAALEKRLDGHDETLTALFAAIRRLLKPVVTKVSRREIGFHVEAESSPRAIGAQNHK